MRLAALVALAGLAVLFAVLNLDEVEVNWIVASWSTPLIVVIAVCLLIGAAIGWIAPAAVSSAAASTGSPKPASHRPRAIPARTQNVSGGVAAAVAGGGAEFQPSVALGGAACVELEDAWRGARRAAAPGRGQRIRMGVPIAIRREPTDGGVADAAAWRRG